jgi:hypothetical protein
MFPDPLSNVDRSKVTPTAAEKDAIRQASAAPFLALCSK